MPNKNKWFKSTNCLPDVQPILVESKLHKANLCAFMTELGRKLPASNKTMILFESLAITDSVFRLARNLKIAITQLTTDDEQLFNALERDALRRLDVIGISTEHKETAQALLNVYERYQLTKALSQMFKHARFSKSS